MDDNNISTNGKNNKPKKLILNIVLLISFSLLFSFYFLSSPFGNKDVIIHISSNQSINSVLTNLENERAIRNDLTAKIFIKILKNGKGVIAGDYLIEKNSPVWVVAWQVSRGKHNIKPNRITIIEGSNNEEIAILLADKLSGFRKDLFLSSVENKQGYLFPDTYFFYPLDTTEEIIEKLLNNFTNKTKDLNFGSKSRSDVIIMASILEREANDNEDIGIISGILWKRISINMPLQVDVDKTTYTTIGLPQTPINNPGLNSIQASLNPTNSPYLYYLHDKNGKIYYARSYEEHMNNINRYLK